jgi:predicted dehydrogenase/threonine dehydrogenase-like Zn-dependent dehydrogenase
MKTVLQNVKTGVISVEDITAPVARPGTVLVRNSASLVSAGTEKSVLEFSKANYLQKARQRPDLVRKVLLRAKNEGLWQTYQVVSNLIDQPIQLGYSSAGTVVAVGDGVDDVQVGSKVACAGLFVATHSEMVAVPRNLLVPMPDGVPMEEAAFVALGAIAIQGTRLAPLELGDQVLVYGLGLVGMLSVQLALAAGCRVIGVDLDASKVELARAMGAEAVVAGPTMASTVLHLTGGYGVDKVLMCAATSSNEPIELVPQVTRQKGVLVVVGDVKMDVPRRAYFEKEIDIRISRSYGPGRYDPSYEDGGVDYPYAYVRWTEGRNMASFLDLIGRGRLQVGRLITHRFDVADALQAYELIEGRVREPYLGIVIRYPDARDGEAAVAAAPAASTATPRDRDVRVSFIGAGNFAKAFLLPAFAAVDGVRVQSVCTAAGVSAKTVAAKYHAPIATTNPDDVLTDAAVNLVVIATRHDSHARYVIDGLLAGKAVYVEKPPAISLDELEAITTAYRDAERSGAQPFLAVGYNRRFSPLAAVVRDAVRAPGKPLAIMYRVNAGSVPATEWVHDPRVGGGRVIGECGHFIDFITYLVGQPAVRMSASAVPSGSTPKPDVVTITLEYGDGSIGTVHYFANGDSRVPKEYVEAFGGGVTAQLHNFRSVTLFGAKARGKTRYFNQVKGFAEEAKAVIDAVRAGGAGPIPFDQLYATSKATLLFEQALTSGAKVAL